jgi:hypothetical protein
MKFGHILSRRFSFATSIFTGLFCSVADPDLGSGAFLTPGSGMGRKSASGSRMNNPNHIFYSLETFFCCFGVKILKFLMRIWDSGWREIGSGMEKVGSGINIPDPQHCFFESCVL